MKLECFQVQTDAAAIVPGALERGWMSDFADRHPYRCLPLAIANTTGWALLCPAGFAARWNGGPDIGDLVVEGAPRFAMSHFGGGVLTFHPGWLFRTEPGWDLWAGGPPNEIKDGIQPLVGIVETYWLPFTFTMNWRFTRPGAVRFEKNEPFCWIMPVPHAAIDAIEPVARRIEDDPELHAEYRAWSDSRQTFNDQLRAFDADAVRAGWQRDYHRGRTSQGAAAPPDHINRRRLKPLRDA